MDIYLYNFNKKGDSTARPSEAGQLLKCDIKSPSSLLNPTLLLEGNVKDFNYAYIPLWGRYYFITGITFANGLWVLDLSVDTLASYKEAIGNYTGYVLRSSSTSDGNIIDSMYPMTSNVTISRVSKSNHMNWAGFQQGWYVLGLQGMYGADTDGSVYYLLTPTAFKDVVNNFYANNGDGWWGNLAKGVRNSLNRIDDYITSCRWYPIELYNDGVDHRIFLGSFNTGINAPKLKLYPNQALTNSFTIPKHPKASSRGSYLNYYPYSKYEFMDPLIGNITLNPAIMKNNTTLYSSLMIDPTTGEARYKLYTVEVGFGERIMYQTAVKVGVDLSLNGANVDVLGVAGSVLQAGVSASMGNMLGVAGAIGNAIVDGVVEPGSNRSSGGFAPLTDSTCTLTGYFMDIVDADNANKGRPLCQNKKINTLSGYMVVDNPHVTISGLSEEQEAINNYLSGGFYYE